MHLAQCCGGIGIRIPGSQDMSESAAVLKCKLEVAESVPQIAPGPVTANVK